MVFQVMFVFSHKRTFRAVSKKIVKFDVQTFRFFEKHLPIEHFFWFDMHLGVSPKVFLGNSYKITLLTFECLDFSALKFTYVLSMYMHVKCIFFLKCVLLRVSD